MLSNSKRAGLVSVLFEPVQASLFRWNNWNYDKHKNLGECIVHLGGLNTFLAKQRRAWRNWKGRKDFTVTWGVKLMGVWSKKHILNIIDCYGITWACTHPNGWWITRNTKQISKKFHFINSLQEENNWKVKREGSWGYYECSHAHKLWTKGEGSV